MQGASLWTFSELALSLSRLRLWLGSLLLLRLIAPPEGLDFDRTMMPATMTWSVQRALLDKYVLLSLADLAASLCKL